MGVNGPSAGSGSAEPIAHVRQLESGQWETHLANSVVVQDKAQLLPLEFLQPILDTLNLLVAHYGVTVVLSTVT